MKKNQRPSWQRLTSSTLLPIIFTHLSFPVYAAVQQHIKRVILVEYFRVGSTFLL